MDYFGATSFEIEMNFFIRIIWQIPQIYKTNSSVCIKSYPLK